MVQAANGNITIAELGLKEGLIEESLEIASDELELARKMVEWKACVPSLFISIQNFLTCFYLCSWEEPIEKFEPGQWGHIGKSK